MKEWTLIAKRKMVIVLICMVMAGIFGYIETLIPAIFVRLPYLRVHIAMLFVIFVLLCYSPIEASIVWGVRCLVWGLMQDDGYAIIFELMAGVAALVALWSLLRTRRFGSLPMGAVLGIVYAFVYACLACIVPKSGVPLTQLAESMTFYAVNHLALGVLSYLALRYIPPQCIFDKKSK
jgi:hypothetical protein